MRRKPKLYGSQTREMVKERVAALLEEAAGRIHDDPSLASRYVYLARRYSMRYKVRFSSRQRRRVCRRCGVLLVPGRNCRVRTREGKLIYLCKNCNTFYRIPFRREQRGRRRAGGANPGK